MGQIIIETEIGLGDFVETIYGDTGSVENIGKNRQGDTIYLVQSGIGKTDWLYEGQIVKKIDK